MLPIIRHHKEHWDGTGYPDGVRGDDIPLGAQIVGVVNVFCALTSDRPYRKAMSYEDTIEELRKRGQRGFHDPALVEKFILCLHQHHEDRQPELVPATAEDAVKA